MSSSVLFVVYSLYMFLSVYRYASLKAKTICILRSVSITLQLLYTLLSSFCYRIRRLYSPGRIHYRMVTVLPGLGGLMKRVF